MSKFLLGVAGCVFLGVGAMLVSISSPSYTHILIVCIVSQIGAIGSFFAASRKMAWPSKSLPILGILVAGGIFLQAAIRL